MFNETHSNQSRPTGALEVAKHARAQEKSMALLVGGIQAKTPAKPSSFLKQILTTLLSGVR
jgi:hypothetical protein